MGLDDRDYMRDVPIYRELAHGGSRIPPSDEVAGAAPMPVFPAIPRGTARRKPQTRPWAWFGLGAVTVLALLALVLSHRGTSAPRFVPSASPTVAPPLPETIAGPARALVGSILTLQGSVAPDVQGTVSVDGRWDNGLWMPLATTQISTGGYRLRVPLDRRGVVDLRVNLPDGQIATETITVT